MNTVSELRELAARLAAFPTEEEKLEFLHRQLAAFSNLSPEQQTRQLLEWEAFHEKEHPVVEKPLSNAENKNAA
ncbi:hypothetical protein [Siphonobacter sp.]|uniref:hypothetical protein n=1 Tax=Siphonobacter sp. TaxID=1869184 RepID=UPI003B3A422B